MYRYHGIDYNNTTDLITIHRTESMYKITNHVELPKFFDSSSDVSSQ